ncbi:MAG: hypothetical protein V1934_03265 [Methanobacteriota archaeon]
MRPDIRIRKLRGVSAEDESWLREHSVKDLRNLVFEMYNLGEDVSDMVPLVNYMEELEMKLITEQKLVSGEEMDIDVMDMVHDFDRVCA